MQPLPQTFVSFSSADKRRYDLMCAWKAHEHIDFNFADFQLDEAINSQTFYYIKTVCAAKIRRADTFVLLIGNDTYTKTVFVKDEVECAVEKGCRLIGVNLNNCRFRDHLCPAFFAAIGALFVPFASRIIAEALTWRRQGASPSYYFFDEVYTRLGYQLVGTTALLPRRQIHSAAATGHRGRDKKPSLIKPSLTTRFQDMTTRPNQAIGLTAGRRTIQLFMTSTGQFAATRDLARSGLSCFR